MMGGALKTRRGGKELGALSRGVWDTEEKHRGHTEDIQESTGTKDVWERHCGHYGGAIERTDERH